jgi:hypothetical protein
MLTLLYILSSTLSAHRKESAPRIPKQCYKPPGLSLHPHDPATSISLPSWIAIACIDSTALPIGKSMLEGSIVQRDF